jgi:autotransporter-associated beta strand protein
MSRITIKLTLACCAALATASSALAIDTSWTVLGGGAQNWQVNGNWSPATFPNSIATTANLSVPLTANLNVSLGGSDITVGGLNIGGTGAAVTTEISGGKLVLSNNDDPDFDDDNDIDGTDFLIWQRNLGVGTTNATGDANFDGVVNAADLRAWQLLAHQGGTNATAAPPVYLGRVTINSQGVAGATNTISALVRSGVQIDATPTYRSEIVEVRGANSLNLAGGYRLSGDGNILRNFLGSGATLSVGPIALEEDTEPTPTPPATKTSRTLTINDQLTSVGRVELTGVISGGGGIALGANANPPAAGSDLSTFVISGNNTFAGRTTLNRGNLVLAHDSALGIASAIGASPKANLRTGGPSNFAGFNLLSDNDSRIINVPHQMGQFTTITGEHSLTWAGVTGQTNSRGFINILPAGEIFTHSGTVYAVANTDLTRTFTFDGSGKTVVTGALSANRYNFTTNTEDNGEGSVVAAFTKAGSGVLQINGPAQFTGTFTANGGNTHFADYTVDTLIGSIVLNYGAVGVDTGNLSNSFFIAKIGPTSTGGLMIDDSEAAATFDFNAGDLGSITGNGANISLAAPENGLTFTGSIVPANNTYRLGGGVGTLTLPNAQLTGANALVATNGGVVQLNGANTYSGTTSALAKYTSSLTTPAVNNGATNNAALSRVYGGTVLATNNLANGGAASGIGNSSNAASNLVIQGSTFRYNGAGASTDRLFTVGAGGATVESSGAGAVNFTNTAALAMDEAESRDGTTATNANITGLTSTADLVVGMGISGTNIPANATITAVTGPTSITISANAAAAGANPLTFTSIARTLTLGGTNAGDNTLRPNIVNGTAATSVEKTGAGKWILTGTNTYTGTTTVTDGTLLVNGANSGNGAVSVAAGATLGGTGSITGAITVNGTLAAGASAGTLTVTGPVTFNAGSTAAFEIGGTSAGQFDELNLSGALTAGGTLSVALINGFVPIVGNAFDILDFASASGTFTLNLPNLGAGKAWNTSTLLTTGTISVAAGAAGVPEPASAVLALGAIAMLRMRRRES